MDLPIVCTLNESELQRRRRELLDRLQTQTLRAIELPDGYCYEFSFDREIVMMLAHIVGLEHECCPFLSFRISVKAGENTLAFEITGAPEAKLIIADLFGSSK
jgi:hypothetical protein